MLFTIICADDTSIFVNSENLNTLDTLSRVSQVKFLGIIVDDKLIWKPHIDYIFKKSSKAIDIMYGLTHMCSLYYS